MKNLFLTVGILLASSFSYAAKNLNMTCSVVQVGSANNYVLEEGLGSIYDITDDGYADADGDSTGVSILVKNGKVSLRLGQGSWDSSGNKISMKSFQYSSDLSEKLEGVEITVKDGIGELIWRAFPSVKIAIVNYMKSKTEIEHLATIDCSGVKDIRLR